MKNIVWLHGIVTVSLAKIYYSMFYRLYEQIVFVDSFFFIKMITLGGRVCKHFSEEIKETADAKFLHLSHGLTSKFQFVLLHNNGVKYDFY